MNPADPDSWTEKDWRAHDAAVARVSGAKADAFARALDLLGWMIVPQQQLPGVTGRWTVEAGACPWWADEFPPDPPDPPDPPKPRLRLIPGGKDDVPCP
jgi:hypothetical protein